MTWLGFKVQGVITRQTLGSWFWGGEITGWVSHQWACCPICVLQAGSRRRDSLEFRHGRDRRVLREVHDGCRRLAQPRRVVLGASSGESFPRCPSELLQACILKRARATTCGDKPASELGNGVFFGGGQSNSQPHIIRKYSQPHIIRSKSQPHIIRTKGSP